MLADFTLCRSNQKGRKSVEAVRERVTPKLGRKTRNKKTPLLRRCRRMKERFSNGGMGGTVVPLSIGKPSVCYNLPSESDTLFCVESDTLSNCIVTFMLIRIEHKNPPTFLMEKESRGNTEQQTIEPSASVSQRAVEGCFPALPVILSLMP